MQALPQFAALGWPESLPEIFVALITVLGTVIGLFAALFRINAARIEYKNAKRASIIRDRASIRGRSPDFPLNDIKSAIDKYVVPDCAQTDPSNSSDLRRVAAVRENIISAVDSFVDNSDNRHLLVLADTGMGKTTFCLNYLSHRLKLHESKGALKCAIVPLGRPGAIDKMISIEDKSDTIILLDAFDEDIEAVDDASLRLSKLMTAASEFAVVIVTCRSQFFRNDAEIPHRTGVKVVRPRRGGVVGEHVFETIYILPFKQSQVDEYLKYCFPAFSLSGLKSRSKANEIVHNIPELSVRPMLLSLLPDLVREKQTVTHLFDLYEFMVRKWLERESAWIEPEILLAVSKSLSVYIYASRSQRGGERIGLEELHGVARDLSVPKEAWKHLSARSLLNRDSEGDIKFSHRSILEFLFVKAAIEGEPRCFSTPWTDFMRELFVSWGHTADGEQRSERAKEILGMDLKSLGLTPLGRSLPLPTSYNQRSYLRGGNATAGRRIARGWRTHSTRLVKARDQRVLQDDEHGLFWVVPSDEEYGDPSVRVLTHSQLVKGKVTESLASKHHLFALLEAEETLRVDLLPRDVHIWLGDTIGRNGPIVISISVKELEADGARLIGAFPQRDWKGKQVWAYSVITRPQRFADKVPYFAAVPTMVSEIDWEIGLRLASMNENQLSEYIDTTFNSAD